MFDNVAEVEREDPALLAPVLLGLSDGDVAALPIAAAEAVVLAAQRVLSAVAARQSAAVETVARRCDEEAEAARVEAAAVGARLPHVGGEAVATGSLAALLRISPRTMSRRVRRARQVVCLLPEIHEAAWAGDLEPFRVEALAREADAVPFARLHEFEARLLTKDVTDLSCTALRRWARRCAERCTAADASTVAERARSQRGVRLVAGDLPGMTTLVAELPTPTATRLWSAIDELASQYVRAQPGMRVDAARADALADLIEANTTIRTTVELVAPIDCETPRTRPTTPTRGVPGVQAGATSSVGHDCRGRPCEVLADGELHCEEERSWFVSGSAAAPGGSELLPADVAALLEDPDVTIRLGRTDGYTGAVRWQDPTSYRPGAAVARAVRSRDGTCRFPGCATPAHRCQLDHVVRFPAGRTTVSNLQSLCATHHGFKHHAGWQVTMTREGICAWSAPDGRTHTTMPLDRHGTAAA